MLKWLLKAGAYTVFLRVIATVTTLAFVSVMSLWMDKTDYGVLAILISLATLAAAVGGFGQSEQIVRDVPMALSEGKTDEAARLVNQASNRVFVVSLPVGLAVAAYFLWAGQSWIVATAAFGVTVALSYNLAWSGAARSHEMFLWALAPKDIFWRLGTLAVCGGLVLLGLPLGIDLTALILLVVLAVFIVLQGRVLNLQPGDVLRPPSSGQGDWATGAALMLSIAAITAQNTIDVVLVGTLLSPEAAAEYFPANRIALMAGFFFVPFQLVISPRLSRMVRSGDIAGAKKIGTFGTLIVSLASIGVAAALILGYDLYEPAFGTATDATQRAVQILVGGQIIVALMGFPGVILVAVEAQKIMARINILFLFLGTGAMYLAATTGQIEAVAWAAVLNIVARKLAITAVTVARSGIWPIHLRFSHSQGGPA